MTGLALLEQCQERGIILIPAPDGTVRCRAPKGVLTLELFNTIRQYKDELHTLLRASEAQPTSPAPVAPEPLGCMASCVVCRDIERKEDKGIWRCVACWPEPLTQKAQPTEPSVQAAREIAASLERSSRHPEKRRDIRLGPVLPPCAVCGDVRFGHAHKTDTWHCWTCTPPVLRVTTPALRGFEAPPGAAHGTLPGRGIPLPRYPAPCWRCKGPSERQGLRFLLCPQCQAEDGPSGVVETMVRG